MRQIRMISAIFAAAAALASCGNQTSSGIKVTDIEHTEVKRQSIGNCWIYATVTWAESLHLAGSGNAVNLSESYLTYYHWLDQLENSYATEVSTGGWFTEGARLIREYGMMLEGDFIPSEANEQMSFQQADALDYINAQLQAGGILENRSDRTRENIKAVLNQAFGVDIDALSHHVIQADDIIVRSAEGETATLLDMISFSSALNWQQINYPKIYAPDYSPDSYRDETRAKILKRVMRALNDKQPVIMSFFVDFNALNPSNGTFDKEYFNTNGGIMGRQGGHMLVLEDYTVDNAPGFGYIGEGLASPEEMEAALEGDLLTLVAKNSWGTDRPERGLTDGYTRFTIDYLNEPAPKENGGHESTLWNFYLPAGY